MKESRNFRRIAVGMFIGVLVTQTVPLSRASGRNAAQPRAAASPGSATQSANAAPAGAHSAPEAVKHFPGADVHAAFDKRAPLFPTAWHAYPLSPTNPPQPVQ